MVLFLDLGVFESFETSPNDKDLIVEGLMEVLGKSFCFEGLKVSFTASKISVSIVVVLTADNL